MSKILSNLNIGTRLTVAFGVLIVLMVASGGVGLYTENLKQEALDRQFTSIDGVRIAQNINIQLLEARRREKDFLLRWQSEGFDAAYQNYVLLNQQHTQNIRDGVDELLGLLEADEQDTRDTLNSITQNIQKYDRTFADVITKIKQRGFIDTGLEGEFRVAAHDLEASPIVVGNPDLTISLLEMRRNEKDYLLRGLQVDIDDTAKFTKQFQDQVNNLTIFNSDKTLLIQLAADYLTKFNQLVATDVEIKTEINDFRADAQAIEPLVNTIETAETNEAARLGGVYADVDASARNVTLLLLGAAVVIGTILSALIYRSITVPVHELTRVTEGISQGDLNLRSEIVGKDELGTLGQTVNSMADQIQGLISGLEVRTRDLQTVADVNSQVSTILEVDRLLRDVSDLTKERFQLYHSHIYILNDAGDTLLLAAGAGNVGRQMVSEKRQIAFDNPQSIVASAGRNRKGVIINDVRESPTFLPHPLLPDTRSELAVPLIARGALVGVLDVQSNIPGYFTQQSLVVMELMAAQIAVAVSNARLYEISERTSRRERALGAIDRKIQGAVGMDEILQATVRELGKALRVPYTAIELQVNADQPADTSVIQKDKV